jgi:hypothetical protein
VTQKKMLLLPTEAQIPDSKLKRRFFKKFKREQFLLSFSFESLNQLLSFEVNSLNFIYESLKEDVSEFT